MASTQLPIKLGDDEESDHLPPEILERIGWLYYFCWSRVHEYLRFIGQSNDVLDLLKNRHLRTMIRSVDRSINPADDMQKAMMEPIFVQFVDQLLMIVENKDISKNWKEISDSSIIQSNWDLYLCQKFAFTRSYQDKLLFLFV